jgi:hypothetical protein
VLIPTQCIRSDKGFDQNKYMSIATNISVQIANKQGHSTRSLERGGADDKLAKWVQQVDDQGGVRQIRTLICAFERFEESPEGPNQKKGVLALAYTFDDDFNQTRFYFPDHFLPKQPSIDADTVKECLKAALEDCHHRTGVLPQNVIVYRCGDSDGQVENIRKEEVEDGCWEAFKDAKIQQLQPEWEPGGFAYIMVSAHTAWWHTLAYSMVSAHTAW